jgi:hypothetical protein
MMSHWYLVLPDPPEAALASTGRSENTSAAGANARPSNLRLFIAFPFRFFRPLQAHLQRLTPRVSAAAVQLSEL